MPKTINNGWLATDPPLILVFFSVNSYSLKYFSMGNTHSEGYCWQVDLFGDLATYSYETKCTECTVLLVVQFIFVGS